MGNVSNWEKREFSNIFKIMEKNSLAIVKKTHQSLKGQD